MFLNYCKNCRADVDPVLDTNTDKVVCPVCSTEFTNISPFVKVQLKAFGQTRKADKQQKAFSTKCPHCQVDAPPLAKSKDLFVCSKCGEELNLSAPFKALVLQNIKVSK